MKNILSKAFVAVCLTVMTFAAVAQNSFSYQAIIRDGGKVLENKTVSLRLSVMTDDSVYYQEKHAVTTNAYGNVSVSVGEGEMLRGSFDAIPWETMQVMMQVEVSADGTDNYVNMGSMQILPVPYTTYAASTATIIQPKEATEDPIFEVRDSEGNLMFAVYETGVKVFVDQEGTKAAKSKFAVAGLSAGKGEQSLLTINADGTTVYVDNNNNENDNTNKAAKSKFAVASLSSKGNGDLLTIDGSGSTIYVDQDADGKAAKSKFAVAGHSAKGKNSKNNYSIDNNNSTLYVDFNDNASKTASQVLSIDGSSATFYVDDTKEGKAAKSGFAVARVGANKDVQTAFVIDGSGTVIYIDDLEGDKAAKSTFAVAGQSAQKGNNNFFIIHRDSTRIYVYDEPASVDTATGTVITPSLTSAFAVTGITKKENMLVVNRDSTIVKMNTYVEEEVQSTSGVVERIADDTKPNKVYTTGSFELQLSDGERSYSDYVDYTYYRNTNGDEYLYLKQGDGNYEYQNFWLVDGKIYCDTIYMYLNFNNFGIGPIHQFRKTVFNSIWTDEWDRFVMDREQDDGLLIMLESKIREKGYKVRYTDEYKDYYKAGNEDFVAVRTAENTVTELSDVELFKKDNSIASLRKLLDPSLFIKGYGFSMSDVEGIEWNSDGYILFDDDVTVDSILKKESYQIGVLAEDESEIFEYKEDVRRQTLAEIDSMFQALRNNIYKVTILASEGGTVIGGGEGNYHYGDSIKLVAESDEGFAFSTWSDGCTDNPRVVYVTNDLELSANFITGCEVILNVTGNGSVIVYGNGQPQQYTGVGNQIPCLTNTRLYLSTQCGDEYVFTGWSESNTNDYLDITVTKDTVLTANFIKGYKVSVNAYSGGGVKVNDSDSLYRDYYNYFLCQDGDSIVLNAVADEGYEFAGWTDDWSNAKRTIKKKEDGTYFTAKFEKKFEVSTAEGIQAAIDWVVEQKAPATIYIDGTKGPIIGNFTIPKNTYDKISFIGKNDAVLDGTGCNKTAILYCGVQTEVVIKNLKITGEKYWDDGSRCWRGDGVFVQSYAHVLLENVEITGNYVGLAAYYGTAIIESGTQIYDNETNVENHTQGGQSDGIKVYSGYVQSLNYEYRAYHTPHPKVSIKGDARIDTIYLNNGGYYDADRNTTPGIFLEGSLTYHNSENPIVVVIRDEDGIRDQPLIKKANADSPVDLAVESAKFKLTNDGYYIDDNGFIRADYVDLKLSSGKKWTVMNIGANSEEESGYYFAWGATEAGTNFNFADYSSSDAGAISANLSGDNDVATKLGAEWSMPTKDDFQELWNECHWEWTDDFKGDGSGITGYIVYEAEFYREKDKGFNHNSSYTYSTKTNTYIFLPAADYMSGSEVVEGPVKQCLYWSATYYNESMAVGFSGYETEINTNNNANRYEGRPIRAVKKPNP